MASEFYRIKVQSGKGQFFPLKESNFNIQVHSEDILEKKMMYPTLAHNSST